MFTLAAPSSRLQPSTLGKDIDGNDLESELGSNWRLRFSAPLEEAYESDKGAARTLRHIVCNLLGTASFTVLSALDLARIGGGAELIAALRLGVIGHSLVVTAMLWLFCRSGRGRLREALTTLGTLMVAAYAVVVARYMYDAQMLMQGSGLLTIFLHVGIAARLRFRFALGTNVLTWAGYAIFARSGTPETALILQNHLMLFGLVLLFSTVGNYLLEFRERRNYLLECVKALHHAALLADAESLRQLTLRDGLTGLFNRRHLDAEMARACAVGQPTPTTVGLLHVDIDHFKRYNDRHGHPAGDACLSDVGAALDAVATRHGGIAARVGGEEFALLLPGHDPERAAVVGAQVCEAVAALRLPHGDSPTASCVSVSVGAAASTPAPGVWASTLIGAADAALYAAKRQGRNRCVRFEAPLVATTSARVRRSGESLPPDAREAPADALAAMPRLSALLERGPCSMRFPPDLEAEFQERGAAERRRQLAFLVAGGLMLALIYIVLCRPVMPDIADLLFERVLALTICGLGLATVNLKVAFGWRVREGILSFIVCAYALTVLCTEALSQAATVYSATLALCLLPMFTSLVAAQPFRFSLVPSLLIGLGIGIIMVPHGAQQQALWPTMFSVLCSATLYSLVGGYLLELSNRRAYLLDRLRVAQLAVLRHNTEHLQRLATLDPLTRLPNRRHFEAELDRLAAASARTRQPLALLILDVDHFKHYNDGYGHPAGDACLQRVGTALQEWVRSGALSRPLAGVAAVPAGIGAPIPARIGGEEFGVLLPATDASGALAAAQRLRERVRDLRIEHAHSPIGRFVTVSVGAASLVLDSDADARLLLKAADAALYRAKGLGRDRAAA